MDEQKRLTLSHEDAKRYLKLLDPTLQLGQCIGSGGSCNVYKLAGIEPAQVVKIIDTRVFANNDGHEVSSKRVRQKCIGYLKQEIECLLQFRNCEYIMPIYRYAILKHTDLGLSDNSIAVFLIFMPEMTTLLEYTKTHDLMESDVVQLGLDIGSALQACANQKIIHRDVKAPNIFVFRQNGKLRFVLGDFGVSRKVENLGKELVTRIGTPDHIAPEIRQGRPIRHYNSDVFSLGVVLYSMLAKTYPYNDVIFSRKWCHIPKIPDISTEFFKIIETMLQLNQDLRYHHPDDMLAALKTMIPVRRRPVVSNQYELSAREHMLQGKYQESAAEAAEGIRRGENACRRILAYCQSHLAPQDPGIRDKSLHLLHDQCMEEDYASIFLRGMIFGLNQQWEDYVSDLRIAAEAHYVPACYYYGHALLYGQPDPSIHDKDTGLLYIQEAAERNFYPALRILKRCVKDDPALADALTEELQELLKLDYPRDDPRQKRDYVRYI